MLSLFCDRVTVDRAVTEKFDGVPMAPGMKYRHYAPDCPLTVIDGSDMDFRRFIAEKEGRERFGVICFDEDLPYITCQLTVSCGPSRISCGRRRRFSPACAALTVPVTLT